MTQNKEALEEKLKKYRPLEDTVKAREYLSMFCNREHPSMSIPPDVSDFDMVFCRIISKCEKIDAALQHSRVGVGCKRCNDTGFVMVDNTEGECCYCDKESLIEELEEVINETHDVDVTDRHYAQNVVDHLHAKGHLNQCEPTPEDEPRQYAIDIIRNCHSFYLLFSDDKRVTHYWSEDHPNEGKEAALNADIKKIVPKPPTQEEE